MRKCGTGYIFLLESKILLTNLGFLKVYKYIANTLIEYLPLDVLEKCLKSGRKVFEKCVGDVKQVPQQALSRYLSRS